MVIVYHTDTGFTREYAMLLSRAEGVRICSLEEAGYQLQPGERVLFLGPLMAGTIKGLKKARAALRGRWSVRRGHGRPQARRSWRR